MLAVKTKLTCLAEQILQILPSYSVGKLEITVNKLPNTSLQKKRKVTNVGDVDLTASSTTASAHSASKSAAAAEATTNGTTFISASASCWRTSKSGFCLTILDGEVSTAEKDFSVTEKYTYLADVNKSSHEVLVAESVDGQLRLLLRGILYNAIIS
jgi:hypothetical protein